jgi:hypothetical protein
MGAATSRLSPARCRTHPAGPAASRYHYLLYRADKSRFLFARRNVRLRATAKHIFLNRPTLAETQSLALGFS